MMKLKIITDSDKMTKEIATALAELLSQGDVLTLEGDLGVGKTTFTQGLAVGLGVKRHVTSPTFTIIKEYNGRIPLYHMDVYRLEFSDEDIGFEEYFSGEGVTVVEWAKFIEEFLPEERLSIHMQLIDESKRKIIMEAGNEHYEDVLKQLHILLESNGG